MKYIIVILTIIGFLALAQKSQEQHGYTPNEVKQMSDLIDRSTGVMFVPRNEQERADVVMDVWNIKEVQLTDNNGRMLP